MNGLPATIYNEQSFDVHDCVVKRQAGHDRAELSIALRLIIIVLKNSNDEQLKKFKHLKKIGFVLTIL